MANGKYEDHIWTKEMCDWLLEHKDLNRNEVYRLFKEAFPETTFSFNGINAKRSRLGATPTHRPSYSTKQRPLYSEQKKKGYIRIKVAQPNVWMMKQKWVFLETHPERLAEVCETDVFIFLDGDRRNFHPDNIELVHRREQTILLQMGGVVPGNPELTKIHLLQARMKLCVLDAGEKAGLTSTYGSGRMMREEFNAKRRAYHNKKYREDPEYRKKIKEWAKRRAQNMTPEQKEKLRAYQREWQRKHRGKKNVQK